MMSRRTSYLPRSCHFFSFRKYFAEGQCASYDEWRNNTNIVRNSRGQEIQAWTLAPSINKLIHITMAKEKATISATLGHEYEDLEEREDFLANNADSVEKMEFIKRFNSDELMKKKDLFALQSARASDIEEEIKDFREQKKAELKPIKEEISSLLKEIKQKGSMVNEKVYKFVDREAKMTAFYDKEGNLVSSRPATRDELPSNVYSINRDQQAM